VTVSGRSSTEPRILILAPTTRDAELTHAILSHARLGSEFCRTLFELLERLEAGVDAVMLPEEVLVQDEEGRLGRWVERQPPWSDLPILVLARGGSPSPALSRGMAQLGNVTVLERPMRAASLVSAVNAALRARRRQYQARDHLARIESSERELREFFENATVGIHWVDGGGAVIRVNEAMLDLLGCEREDVLGRPVADLHVDPGVIADILDRVEDGEVLRDVEVELRRPDGTIRHVLINAGAHWDGERYSHAQLFTRDVTDRKDALATQARLAAIVESSHDAIVSKTLDGTILTWNQGAQRLFGYTPEEAIGRSILMLIPPERRDEEPALIARVTRGEIIDHFETVRIAKGGARLDISLTLSPVRTGDGTITGVSKVARDISQQKRDEAALRLAQQQLQMVTDHMAVAVTHCSRDLRYRWVSPGLASWLGRRADDIIGRRLADVIGPAALATIQPHVDRALRGDVVEFETQVPYAGLGPRWIRASYVPTHGADGEVDGWVAAILDVTERHELEQALLEADHRKDEFLAMLAHELRNPLAPIRNALHILRLTAAPDAASRRVTDMMERQVNHLVRLVDDLLEVSRITRGRIELRKERTDLAAVVRSAVETSRPPIDAAGHRLEVVLPEEPLVVECDAVRIAQVLSNLLNNAARYTEPSGRITLEVRREDASAVVTVRDTGIGIAKAMLGRIFEMFVQSDPQDGRAQGGLGIGLALVRRLVEMHGGTVEAASAGQGQGSEFTVRLPLATAGAGDRSPDTGLVRPAEVSGQRVLVVDDNRDAAQSLGVLLKLVGVDVHVAYSGQEALDALPVYRPDVVLLDLGMPGMDGEEVARRIRSDPGFIDVRLIALTGWGQQSDRARSRAAGFDYHLIKPADVAALTAVLESSRQAGRRQAGNGGGQPAVVSPPSSDRTSPVR
jgi:two-component system CheB/CheR fusion protein